MGQAATTEDELRNKIQQLLAQHRFMIPREVAVMTNKIMKMVNEFIASQNMQKPF